MIITSKGFICRVVYACMSMAVHACMHGCEFEVDIGCPSVLGLIFSK